LFAAVGHDAWITRVNLSAAAVANMWQIPVVVEDVVLTAAYVYVTPRTLFAPHASLSIATGAATFAPESSYTQPTHVKLSAEGSHIFIANNSVARYSIGAGLPVYLRQTNPGVGPFACGNVWPTADGQRLVTACATVLRVSDIPSQDLTAGGSLSGLMSVGAALHMPARDLLYAIAAGGLSGSPDAEVLRYGYENLTFQSRFPLPMFQVGSTTLSARAGRSSARPTATRSSS
jgi:hypothetical protein